MGRGDGERRGEHTRENYNNLCTTISKLYELASTVQKNNKNK